MSIVATLISHLRRLWQRLRPPGTVVLGDAEAAARAGEAERLVRTGRVSSPLSAALYNHDAGEYRLSTTTAVARDLEVRAVIRRPGP